MARPKLNVDNSTSEGALTVSSKSIDPALAALFASSKGPVKSTGVENRQGVSILHKSKESSKSKKHSDDIINEVVGLESSSDPQQKRGSHDAALVNSDLTKTSTKISARKRKRQRNDEEDLEARYLQRLAETEVRRDTQNRHEKRQKAERQPASSIEASLLRENSRRSSVSSNEPDNGEDDVTSESSIPQHETVTATTGNEVEKATRTVFLANVSTLALKSKASKKLLLDHLTSFIPSLPASNTPHKVESLRFRSIAFSDSSVPKKAAFAKRDLMDTTTKSMNAYAIYTSAVAAREAVKRLNGTIVLDRHLRVDGVAHPAKTDNRRCVFVGNLGFVDDETAMRDADDTGDKRKTKKPRVPADVEEGLWRQFSKAGTVESVRVVRDKTTRVGKGIAYVQFENSNAVERALLYNDKKFPPLLPRALRVTRAKNISKTASRVGRNKSHDSKAIAGHGGAASYRPKAPSQVQSLSGRATKLLGRAGAAQLKNAAGKKTTFKPRLGNIEKTPESVVFEGYRASRREGIGKLKLGGSGKKQGKPRTRSSKRGTAFKVAKEKKR